MLAHQYDLWNDRVFRPVHAKHFGQFLQVLSGCLANGEYGVPKPAHAKCTELFVKELYAKLTCKKGDIFDDGQTDTPLLIFRQLYNRRE